jgi:GT2 family glycosyltransferase/glycosyltransferase involved in cell wall biosynthesis
MKIAYVDGNGTALVSALARCLAAGGHDVWVVGGETWEGSQDDRVTHVPLLPPLERKGWYFDPAHQYADQVYATLRKLDREVALDVVEFAERGGEGFTTLRAKRLLAEFSHTTLVVRLDGSASPAERPHTDFGRAIRAYLERYSLLHADVVTSSSHHLIREVAGGPGITARYVGPGPLLEPAVTQVPNGARLQPSRAVFIGPLDPLAGADAFVRIALHAIAPGNQLTFHLYGEDTDSGPFGTSFAEHLRAQLRAVSAEGICISGPLSGADLAAALDGATFCVFPASRGALPDTLPLALDRGCVVVADATGPAAELVEHGQSGLLLNTQAPEAAARELLACSAAPAVVSELSAGARRQAARLCRDDAVRARLEAAYGASGRRLWSSSARPGWPTPRVSIVIPLYNQGHYVHEAIRSARASTYRDIEIVVVDDGSTDPYTVRLFDEMTGVVKVRKANGGIASALNAGIAASSGRYLLPLGADDLIHPEYLAKGLAALERNPDLSYVTCYARYFGLLDMVHVPVGYVPELMLFLHTDGKATTLFDAEAVRSLGGYDEDLFAFEDWELLIRLHKGGFHGDVLPSVLFSYRRHAASTVYTRSNFKRVELLQFLAAKHQDLLAEQHRMVVAHLLYLWKTGYEPSPSVRQQMAAGAFDDRPPA